MALLSVFPRKETGYKRNGAVIQMNFFFHHRIDSANHYLLEVNETALYHTCHLL